MFAPILKSPFCVVNDKEGLISLLESRRGQDASYIGCMKSGEVVTEKFVSHSTFLTSLIFALKTFWFLFRGGQWYEPEWWKFGDEKS